MKIEIKSKYTDKVLFSHEQNNNSFKITLELATKAKAYLSGANLSGAYLYGANLLCMGDMKFIFTMQLDKWQIGFTKDVLQIGCQRHLIEDWKTFDDAMINSMDTKALGWWEKWKNHIFKTIELCITGENL